MEIPDKTTSTTPNPALDQTPPVEPPTEPPQQAHPQFQKRIDQLTAKVAAAEQALVGVRAEKELDKQAFDTLNKHTQDLTKALENVEDKVSATNAPDRETDPEAYYAYMDKRLLEKVKKAQKKNIIPPVAPSPPPVVNNTSDPRELVQAGLHEDFYPVLEDVQKDYTADPALLAHFNSQTDPWKAAYDFGIRKRNYAKQAGQAVINQASVEGGGYPEGGDNTLPPLTAADKRCIQNMGITEKAYMETQKAIIARERGKQRI